MQNVTSRYFPQRGELREYFERVVHLAGLHVALNINIIRIHPSRPCVVIDSSGMEVQYCARLRVLVATGLKPREEPVLKSMGGGLYSNYSREMAYRKKVCILGNGNSGYEVAQNVFDVAERVVIHGFHPMKLSAISRYTGDVRTKFIQVHENFHGKLLDTSFYFDSPLLFGLHGKVHPEVEEEIRRSLQAAAYIDEYKCESLVICTGFRSFIPGFSLIRSLRFPVTNDWYTDEKNPFVHYIGWLMHQRDFQQGPGGFLSGYRYLIRNLVDHFHNGGKARCRLLNTQDATARIIHRFQTADDLLVLQDGISVRDVLTPLDQPDMWRYCDGVTHEMRPDLKHPQAVHAYFAWGPIRGSAQVFDFMVRYKNMPRKLVNMFLHPVLETQGKTRHILEDLEMTWTGPHEQAIRRAAQDALLSNISHFRPIQSLDPDRLRTILEDERSMPYESPQFKYVIDPKVANAIIQSVLDPDNEEKLVQVRNEMQRWKPELFEQSTERLHDATE
jgi:hypothetical protein